LGAVETETGVTLEDAMGGLEIADAEPSATTTDQ
jgi:hypothetical protein